MGTLEINESLKKAVENLRIAEFELNRPSEDVVTLSVCLKARQYMSAMMQLFLSSKLINHKEGESLESLLNLCKAVDPQFESINFSTVFCCELNNIECENSYCLSLEKVNNCIETANRVKLIVLNNIELSEIE